jgi:hypothetical protein
MFGCVYNYRSKDKEEEIKNKNLKNCVESTSRRAYVHTPLVKEAPVFYLFIYFFFVCVRLFEFVFDETPFEEQQQP